MNDKLAVAGDGGAAGAVIRVFPADAVILFVDANDVLHGHGLAVGIRENGAKVVDGAQAVTAEFEIIGHHTCTGVTKIKGCFLVERGTGVGVGDVHVGKGETVEEASAVVADLSK